MRDELSKLIQEANIPVMNGQQLTGVYAMDAVGADVLADHLIANGVTLEGDYKKGWEDGFNQGYSDGVKVGMSADKWIPVTERLPEEHDSIFAKWYGTERWLPGMVRTISDTVIAVVVLSDGKSIARERRTNEGKWNLSGIYGAKEVTHWMPMPQVPGEEAAK